MRLIAAGPRDDGAAELSEQFGNGDRDQPEGGPVLPSRARCQAARKAAAARVGRGGALAYSHT